MFLSQQQIGSVLYLPQGCHIHSVDGNFRKHSYKTFCDYTDRGIKTRENTHLMFHPKVMNARDKEISKPELAISNDNSNGFLDISNIWETERMIKK